MARNLRNDGGDRLIQGKMVVLLKEPVDPSKIYRWEEIFNISVKDPAPVPVLRRIGGYRESKFKAMRKGALVLYSDQDFDFGLATQKEIGQPLLDKLEARLRRHDLSNAATLLFNIERFVFVGRRQFIKDIREGSRFHAEEHGKTVEALGKFKASY